MPTEPTPAAAGVSTAKTAPKPAGKKAPAKKPAAKPAAAPSGGFTVDSFLNALKLNESGDYTAQPHGGSTASGAYQYIDSTWNHYRGYAHAWQAPPAVQDERARADVEARLKEYGGDWSKVAAAHFAGPGWVAAHPDQSTWNVNPAPGSNNPTVAEYVNRLYGHAGQAAPAGSATGTTAGNTFDTGSPSNSDIISQVEGTYGYPAAYLKDPEIGPILLQAAKAGWDSTRLFGALSQTRWWKQHSAATRTFDAQGKLDPATQKQQIMAQADDIIAQAKKSGLNLDQKSVATLAWTSLRYGWSNQQLANAIVAQGKMDFSGKTPNAAVATVDDLRQRAAQYMVPVSDGKLQDWAKQIAGGQFTPQDFDGYLKEQAKSLFPGLASAIDRGVTVETYADPYRNLAASTLEVDPNSIDFMHDPKYQKALFNVDPKTGDRTAMSLADWGQYLRTLPQYAKTAQANDQAAGFADQLLSTFGKVAN